MVSICLTQITPVFCLQIREIRFFLPMKNLTFFRIPVQAFIISAINCLPELAVPKFLSYRKTGTGTVQAYHSFNEYDFIFSAGGLITFSEFFKFKPSILLDYSLNEAKKLTQLDINGNFILGDLIWVGGSWRTSEEVLVGIVQVQLNPQFMFGVSYDYPAGRMNSYSKGSSEFILRYEFGYKVSAANPRYF